MKPAGLVFETGEIFKGFLLGGSAKAGEAVFNTSHAGYEEMATDPSYYNHILIMTAPLQGNYGANPNFWQSENIWIKGFVCLSLQKSERDRGWLNQLSACDVPVLSSVDTRQAVLCLRDKGTVWSAIVPLSNNSREEALSLIEKAKSEPKDWTQAVCVSSPKEFKGQQKKGPKLALIDFGFKKNILTELLKRSSQICVFPSNSSQLEISQWSPDGIVLSNGPGDPKDVLEGAKLVKELLGYRPIFGICMGHQILARAMGASTYRLKFGHRASNHPVKDKLLNKIYMSSQNHGYAVKAESLPKDIQISHINLNDGTVAGFFSSKRKCLGTQFHPENHPGPKEAEELFDFFINKMILKKTSGSQAKAKKTRKSTSVSKKRENAT